MGGMGMGMHRGMMGMNPMMMGGGMYPRRRGFMSSMGHHLGGMAADMMGGGMGYTMRQMMKMKMMMDMMGFNKDKHHKTNKKMCKYYSCIVKTQQAQLKQLMQMMMTSAMTNQAPITISDHTKKGHRMVDDVTQSTVPTELTEE